MDLHGSSRPTSQAKDYPIPPSATPRLSSSSSFSSAEQRAKRAAPLAHDVPDVPLKLGAEAEFHASVVQLNVLADRPALGLARQVEPSVAEKNSKKKIGIIFMTAITTVVFVFIGFVKMAQCPDKAT